MGHVSRSGMEAGGVQQLLEHGSWWGAGAGGAS